MLTWLKSEHNPQKLVFAQPNSVEYLKNVFESTFCLRFVVSPKNCLHSIKKFVSAAQFFNSQNFQVKRMMYSAFKTTCIL